MEVDKLQEITHIQPFPLALFIASCLLFYYFFFLRIHYLFLKGFQNSHFSHEGSAGRLAGTAVSWLAAKEANLFSKKGENVFRVCNFRSVLVCAAIHQKLR